MQDIDLTTAYKAMVRFLEKYYSLTNADEIGSLLGNLNMEVFRDGKTADPAMWDEWMEAVREVIAEQARQSDQ